MNFLHLGKISHPFEKSQHRQYSPSLPGELRAIFMLWRVVSNQDLFAPLRKLTRECLCVINTQSCRREDKYFDRNSECRPHPVARPARSCRSWHYSHVPMYSPYTSSARSNIFISGIRQATGPYTGIFATYWQESPRSFFGRSHTPYAVRTTMRCRSSRWYPSVSLSEKGGCNISHFFQTHSLLFS